MDKLQQIITDTKIDKLSYSITYLDIRESEEEIRLRKQARRDKVVELIVDGVDNSKEIDEIDSFIRSNTDMPNIGLSVYSKSGTLVNKVSSNNIDDVYDKVYDDAIQKIKNLCDKNTNEIEKSNSVNFGGHKIEIDVSQINDEQLKSRRIITRCVSCGNMIATQGRRGPAHIAIMSNLLNSLTNEYFSSQHMKIIIDDSCGNSIYQYRKTSIDEPGLQLVYKQVDNTVYYDLVETGSNPHKQFIRLDVIL